MQRADRLPTQPARVDHRYRMSLFLFAIPNRKGLLVFIISTKGFASICHPHRSAAQWSDLLFRCPWKCLAINRAIHSLFAQKCNHDRCSDGRPCPSNLVLAAAS